MWLVVIQWTSCGLSVCFLRLVRASVVIILGIRRMHSFYLSIITSDDSSGSPRRVLKATINVSRFGTRTKPGIWIVVGKLDTDCVVATSRLPNRSGGGVVDESILRGIHTVGW